MTALFITKSADEYRAMARDARKDADDSFDRCDTDGFLSQWASDTTARQYDLAAVLAENGGEAEFDALFDLDGNIVPAALIDAKYGRTWIVRESFDAMRARTGSAVAFVKPLATDMNTSEDGRVWFTPNKRSVSAAARKGYRYGTISCKAMIVSTEASRYQVSYVAAIHPDVKIEDADVVEVI